VANDGVGAGVEEALTTASAYRPDCCLSDIDVVTQEHERSSGVGSTAWNTAASAAEQP
jgi:hypothetical protein